MTKILEFESVYLELPDDYELDEEENIEEQEEMTITTKLSLEELQRKLEETQSLHL
ncbi:MAG: hypothetical protein J1F35_00060 [Erysipelotrichales bacterium]|nr:hypothetical protein [Erysipelotrichales bacterium]